MPVTLNGPIALVSKQADTVDLQVHITAVCGEAWREVWGEGRVQRTGYVCRRAKACMQYTKTGEWDARLAGSEAGLDSAIISSLSSEAAEWRTIQDGQRILTTTPSVLGGCRAQVYRVLGATQWYTAVIVGVNEHTGELTVTDDTVLEEHSEDPSLVQMRLLGDGVIESIMKGEVVGVMPRRSRSSLQVSCAIRKIDHSIWQKSLVADLGALWPLWTVRRPPACRRALSASQQRAQRLPEAGKNQQP
ncbi:unnamed protein product [Arctia plantaginis]|uniref:Lysine-specific demethylase 3A/B tudor domain-containing protein n=1 Tax=Arctia plantaginis TaxID=874455 RepID=A0A8S1BCE9_ARCPL|nr:unnamed protein product [Arctia plantaginis]